MEPTNRQIILKSRPRGPVSREHFAARTTPLPELEDGQALVRTLYLSIDPTIRGWIDRDTYLPAVEIGAVVRSAGAGVVVESKNPKFSPGDRLSALVGWQQYALVSDSEHPMTIPDGVSLEDALSVFGVTGITAYFGLTEVGKPKPGETVVVSGAAGATGSVVVQIAKAKGCRVIGIAGSAAKCAWLSGELGADAAINYKTENVGKRLRETCPAGIDVFFDNVGGPILNEALALLALHARVVLCGAISQYENFDNVYGPPNYVNLIARRAKMEGFIILDYMNRALEAVAALAALLAEGKLKHKTTVVQGLDGAPDALRRLFTGEHEGKLLVQVAEA